MLNLEGFDGLPGEEGPRGVDGIKFTYQNNTDT